MEVLAHLSEVKGEVVLLVEASRGSPEVIAWWDGMTLQEHVARYKSEGMKTNVAIKQVATDLGLSRQDVYKEYHNG